MGPEFSRIRLDVRRPAVGLFKGELILALQSKFFYYRLHKKVEFTFTFILSFF